MPIDLDPGTGFNQYWDDVVSQFRAEAIDDHLDGGNLDAVNYHITGPVDPTTLASQYGFPVVWTVPINHSPQYQTTSTDHGTLTMRVVVFATDTDPRTAFEKARVLGGHVVDNVEGSALVDDSGTAHAARCDLDDFQMDSRPVSDQGGGQLKFNEQNWSVHVERPYP